MTITTISMYGHVYYTIRTTKCRLECLHITLPLPTVSPFLLATHATRLARSLSGFDNKGNKKQKKLPAYNLF